MGDLTGTKLVEQNGKKPAVHSTQIHPVNGDVKMTGNGSVPNGTNKDMDAEIYDKVFDNASVTSAPSSNSDDSDYESTNCVHVFQQGMASCTTNNSTLIRNVVLFAMLVGYTIYLGFAISYDAKLAQSLVIMTACVVFLILYSVISDLFGEAIYENCLAPCWKPIGDRWHIIQWFFYPALVIGVVLYLVLHVITNFRQLQSISGIVIFISITYITSKYPDRVRWRPVLWGYGLQFAMAIFVLQWETGYLIVKFLGDEITRFINYAYDGAATVYGDPWMIFHPFAFMGASIIIYMGAVLSILYYYGLTQRLAAKTAWLMQVSLGTTAIETLGVASNIFLNGMDTMLMLRNYLERLTPSEFHCFLVGGHATVAGFVFGLFVLFGAPAQHLLSAAVMSAPAVIAITKLNYPETRESVTKRVEDVVLENGEETNVFEACANGASVAGRTAAVVVVNYIAFMGILAFFNATLAWLGGRVGNPELSFEGICSYLFWPIALIIGVEIQDCQQVAKFIGIKIFTTEILAFQELGDATRAGLITERSSTIATYALCGFSSLSTLAVAVGVWNTVCPQKTKEMTQNMFRALWNANMSCFMTACIAGLMFRDDLVVDQEDPPPIIGWFMGILPSYKDLMSLVPGLIPD